MSDKIRTLSQAIRLGATFRDETRLAFFDGRCGCALTAAAEATGLSPQECYATNSLFPHLQKRFGIPRERLEEISTKHFSTALTREQIADWLEAQGL